MGVGEGTRERKLSIIELGEQSASACYVCYVTNFPVVSKHFHKYMDKNLWLEK